MTPIRLIAVSAFVIAVSACSSTGPSEGGGPYNNTPQAQSAPPMTQAAVNPTYDTPAAYEESSAPKPSAEAVIDPGLDSPRSTAGKSAPGRTLPPAKVPGSKPATAAATVGGTSHTVVKGDTLGGIAKKYGVSTSAIMKANNMTKDVVVLGKTLVIPAH